MEGHCSTGQSPQWAVVPLEEDKEKEEKLAWCWIIKPKHVAKATHPTSTE